jgi:elongation factor Ts
VEKMKSYAKEMINPIIQKTGENIQLGDVYEVKGNVLGSYVHNNKIGAIVSLENGDTELAKDIAMHVAAMQPEGIPELLDQAFIKNSEETVGQLLEKAKAKIKEVKVYSI